MGETPMLRVEQNTKRAVGRNSAARFVFLTTPAPRGSTHGTARQNVKIASMAAVNW